MYTRFAILALAIGVSTLPGATREALAKRAPAATGDAALSELRAAFVAYSGAELVFRRADLPSGRYYDRMPTLNSAKKIAAARIALREVRKYPRGFLGDMGLGKIGVFAALVSDKGDGYRPYNKQWRGYLYYGLWNGRNALVASYYTDNQLPLTLHHEIFHHVDATRAGTTDHKRFFAADDDRFAKAVSGTRRYPALTLAPAELKRLRRRATGAVLRTTVSGYAAKGAGEDQAETARHFMTTLPDALIQAATKPELPGSQRVLHVLAQYRSAIALGPDEHWFIDVALGRTRHSSAAQLRASLDRQRARVRERLQPRRDDTIFAVWGGEDKNGVNWTLRADIDQLGRDARRLAHLAAVAPRSSQPLRVALLGNLRLLARYHNYIASRWRITKGTRRTFDRTRDAIVAALPGDDKAQRARLRRAGYGLLASGIAAAGTLQGTLAGANASRSRPNKHLAKVDAAISDARLRAVIRGVQPAAVRLKNGSGVNIAASGLVLTAAHVVGRKGTTKRIEFPDGRRFTGVVSAIDKKFDLALVTIAGVDGLPFATVADTAPRRGTTVVAIGQPGKYTPDGEATGYEPWNVSVGQIRGFLRNRLGSQSLGRTKHDAWTYWGHSGSPLFDRSGAIVAMHNSWDSKTAMRHAVTWEAITDFLARAKAR